MRSSLLKVLCRLNLNFSRCVIPSVDFSQSDITVWQSHARMERTVAVRSLAHSWAHNSPPEHKADRLSCQTARIPRSVKSFSRKPQMWIHVLQRRCALNIRETEEVTVLFILSNSRVTTANHIYTDTYIYIHTYTNIYTYIYTHCIYTPMYPAYKYNFCGRVHRLKSEL